MTRETDELSECPQEAVSPTRSPVDPYRAERELERWLYYGEGGTHPLRGDLPSDWQNRATLVGTMVYNFEKETVEFIRKEQAESPTEDQP